MYYTIVVTLFGADWIVLIQFDICYQILAISG